MTSTIHAFGAVHAAQVRAALACAEALEASAGTPLTEDDLAHELYRHWYVGPVAPEPVEEWWPPLAGMFRAAHAGGDDWADREAEVIAGGIAGVAVVRSASGPRALCQGDYVSPVGAGLAPRRGSHVRACSRQGALVADGWWRTWGPAWDRRNTPPGLIRVYFAVRLAHAPELVARITRALLPLTEPWALKIGVDAATLARADAAVAYLPADAWEAVAPRLVPACAGLVRAVAPPLTAPVAPGIALADEPGDDLSFGESRCKLLARAHRLRAPGTDAVGVAARVFADHGLDPSAPHRRAGGDRTASALRHPAPSNGPGSLRDPSRALGRSSEDLAPDPHSAQLLRAAHVCVDTLLAAGIERGDETLWPSWEVGDEGAERVVTGPIGFYGADAGIVWSLGKLAVSLGRPDAARAAVRGGRRVARLADQVDAGGMLSGRGGLALVLAGAGLKWPAPEASAVTDLTAGTAGSLLALARLATTAGGRGPAAEEGTVGDGDGCGTRLRAGELLTALTQASVPHPWGVCWPERALGERPLCGLSHGNSGMLLALVEASVAWPSLAPEALALAHQAWRWEAAHLDPRRGGWPDLREGGLTYPALWCHGAAGAGAARLRILELSDRLELPWPLDSVRAEAEAAVQACGREAVRVADAARAGEAPALGLTICHGAGGALGVLALAARVLDEPRHLRTARAVCGAVLDVLPEDPGDWPCGLRGADGDLSWANGLAGTALLLAELASPDAASSVVLLR